MNTLLVYPTVVSLSSVCVSLKMLSFLYAIGLYRPVQTTCEMSYTDIVSDKLKTTTEMFFFL
jgi:hypothetical protein